MDNYHGVRHMRISALMKRRKYSDNEWHRICAMEEDAMRNNKKVVVFIKSKQVLIIDEKTRKIKSLFVRSYLSSFQVVD